MGKESWAKSKSTCCRMLHKNPPVGVQKPVLRHAAACLGYGCLVQSQGSGFAASTFDNLPALYFEECQPAPPKGTDPHTDLEDRFEDTVCSVTSKGRVSMVFSRAGFKPIRRMVEPGSLIIFFFFCFFPFRRTSSQRTLASKTHLEETIVQPRVP